MKRTFRLGGLLGTRAQSRPSERRASVLAPTLSAIAAVAVIGANAAPTNSNFHDLCELSPYLLALGMWWLATTALRRAGFWQLVFPGMLILAAGSNVAPELGRFVREVMQEKPAADARPVKVLTANLWSTNYRFGKFIDLLKTENPDIVIVQEANGVWSYVLRSFAPNYKFVAGCTAPSQCNVAILSKFEAVLGSSSWTSAAAQVDLELPDDGGRLTVIGVHASRAPRTELQKDIETVARLALAAQHPLVLAGDFNATPWSGRLHGLDALPGIRRRTFAMSTWPSPSRRLTPLRFGSPLAIFPIDHVYAGEAFATVSVKRLPDFGSDHYAVLATIARSKPDTTGSGVQPAHRTQ